jgi:hypothetical protein
MDGKTPESVQALRCMTQELNAVQRLRKVAQVSSMPGQLYALIGLRILDEQEFKRLLPRYSANTTTVQTVSGCIAGQETVAKIVTWVDQRPYAEEFLPQFRITPVVMFVNATDVSPKKVAPKND